jgi:hypothetical protein
MRLEEDTFALGHQLRLRRSFLMEPSALTGLPASHLLFTVRSLLYNSNAERQHPARQHSSADARWRSPTRSRTGTPRKPVSLPRTTRK